MKREFASVPMPENRAQARGGLTYEEKRHMLRDWVYENCCKGRQMKTPVPRGRDYDVKWAEPNCFGGDNYPARKGHQESLLCCAQHPHYGRIVQAVCRDERISGQPTEGFKAEKCWQYHDAKPDSRCL